MKLEVIQHLDEFFDPADFPIEVIVERVDLVEIVTPKEGSVFLVSIMKKTNDGVSDKEYMAFDTLNEANGWLDMMGYDILR